MKKTYNNVSNSSFLKTSWDIQFQTFKFNFFRFTTNDSYYSTSPRNAGWVTHCKQQHWQKH